MQAYHSLMIKTTGQMVGHTV